MSEKLKIYKSDFSGGFPSINYKGAPVKRDYIEDGVSTMYVKHFRRGSYQTMIDGTPGKHACFQMGFWCWLQAREHPIKALRYLLHV